MENKDHKFIIEVRLRYEAPECPQEGTQEGKPSKPQVPQDLVGNVDPRIINSLLSQLPNVLAAMQQKPANQSSKQTGPPPN